MVDIVSPEGREEFAFYANGGVFKRDYKGMTSLKDGREMEIIEEE